MVILFLRNYRSVPIDVIVDMHSSLILCCVTVAVRPGRHRNPVFARSVSHTGSVDDGSVTRFQIFATHTQ